MRDDALSKDVLSEGHEEESKIERHDELSYSQQQNHYKATMLFELTIKKGADAFFEGQRGLFRNEQSNGESQFKQSIMMEKASHQTKNKMSTSKKTQTTQKIELKMREGINKMDQIKRNGVKLKIILIPNSPEEEGKEQFNYTNKSASRHRIHFGLDRNL